MATMTVIATTAIPDHLRGALTRWMIEPAPGLYVGTLSARVRTELWTAVSASIGDGAAVIDFDGLTLIALNPAEPDNESVNP